MLRESRIAGITRLWPAGLRSSTSPSGFGDVVVGNRRAAARFRLEALRLRLLPYVAKDYAWVEVDEFRLFGRAGHQRFLSRFQKGPVEKFTTELFCSVLRPGMKVVDMGAHLGYFTLLAARRVGRNGAVYAFECDPTNFRFLLHNIRLNRHDAEVVPSSAAITDEIGVHSFFASDRDLCLGSLWHTRPSRRRIDVRCTTLDRVLGGQPIDVAKLDVEGGEVRALDGMRRTIESSADLVMFVECNPRKLPAAGASVAELLERLEQFGFDVHEIDEKKKVLRPAGEWLYADERTRDPKYFVNLYCRKT
jgi:FkbM family methyltransferase